MIDFNVTMLPPLPVVIAQLTAFEIDIRSYREPLKRAIQQVLAPSFRTNFDVGGRPTWAPLAQYTIDEKTRLGFELSPLIRTRLLRQVAGQLNIWTLSRTEATIESGNLPRAEYGRFHMSGTRFMPARPWAVIQPEDEEKVEEIFWAWITERAVGIGGFKPSLIGAVDTVAAQ